MVAVHFPSMGHQCNDTAEQRIYNEMYDQHAVREAEHMGMDAMFVNPVLSRTAWIAPSIAGLDNLEINHLSKNSPGTAAVIVREGPRFGFRRLSHRTGFGPHRILRPLNMSGKADSP